MYIWPVNRGLKNDKTRITRKNTMSAVTADGEQIEITRFGLKSWDGTAFVKVKEYLDALHVDSRVGYQILFFIMFSLQKNHCWLRVKAKEVMAVTGIKVPSEVYRGLKSLEKAGLIQHKDKGEYWINQHFFQNGTTLHKQNPANKMPAQKQAKK